MAQGQNVNLGSVSLDITISTYKIENSTETKQDKEFKVTSSNFIHYIRDEQFAAIGKPTIGISIPTAELKIKVGTPQNAVYLLKADRTKVSINVALAENNNLKNQLTNNYIVTNYDINILGSQVEITLYLLADLGDFISKSFKKAYPADGGEQITSIKAIYEAMKDFEGIINIETDTEAKENEIKETFNTDDKQIWLQCNTPTYQFVANVLKHCNPNNQDLILGAINHNKLKLVSYNSIINKEKTAIKNLIYINLPENERSKFHKDNIVLTPASVSLESSMGVYEYMLGVESIPQVKILGNTENVFDKITSLFKRNSSKQPSEAFESKRLIASKFDCGNTHENYWNAQLANEKKISKIYRNIVYVTTNGYLIDDRVNVLDTAYLNIKGMDQSEADDSNKVLDGNFVVLGISRYISQSVISNRIALGRDSY